MDSEANKYTTHLANVMPESSAATWKTLRKYKHMRQRSQKASILVFVKVEGKIMDMRQRRGVGAQKVCVTPFTATSRLALIDLMAVFRILFLSHAVPGCE